MAYNIQMNYFDGSSYQELYPKTLKENIVDYSSIEIMNYTGTGNYGVTHESTLLFSNNPKFVIIQNVMTEYYDCITLFFNITGMNSERTETYAYNGIYNNKVLESGGHLGMYSLDSKKLVWCSVVSADEQANHKNQIYTAIAFY